MKEFNTLLKAMEPKESSALTRLNGAVIMGFVAVAIWNYFGSQWFWVCLGLGATRLLSALCKAHKNLMEGNRIYD
jgi:hypothetical protein